LTRVTGEGCKAHKAAPRPSSGDAGPAPHVRRTLGRHHTPVRDRAAIGGVASFGLLGYEALFAADAARFVVFAAVLAAVWPKRELSERAGVQGALDRATADCSPGRMTVVRENGGGPRLPTCAVA
jgi:hypothetical protein